MRNQRFRLVEGASGMDDLPSSSGATMPVGGWILSCGGTYKLNNTRSGSLFLLGAVSTGLGRSIKAAANPDGGPHLQFRRHLKAPHLGAPPPKVHRPHWGHLPRPADHWRLDQGSPLK